MSVLAFGPERHVEEQIVDLERVRALRAEFPVTWINVDGLGTVEVLEKLEEILGLHRLALEDVLNIPQRPKVDDYGDHQYIVVRMPVSLENTETEQLSLFLGKNFVLTVQERPGDCFGPVRDRIFGGRPRIRDSGPDYLAYAILDAVVDAYFPPLEAVGQRLEELELEVLENPDRHRVRELHDIKHDLVTLRRFVWPLREVNSALLHPENNYLTEKTRLFMRDCYDHTVHALDLVESYRDVASGLLDLYLSMQSQRMNEVMKVLTIIATIFIPLSFIAGLYGMNFDSGVSRWNMPELSWAYGYVFALGVMAVTAAGMVFYFWRRGWFR